jgi:hypothetical protein
MKRMTVVVCEIVIFWVPPDCKVYKVLCSVEGRYILGTMSCNFWGQMSDTNCQFSSTENYSDLKMARICIVYITQDRLDMRYSDISMKMCERSIGPLFLYTHIIELLAGWEHCRIQMAEMVFSCVLFVTVTLSHMMGSLFMLDLSLLPMVQGQWKVLSCVWHASGNRMPWKANNLVEGHQTRLI